jgi:hypothetical protein
MNTHIALYLRSSIRKSIFHLLVIRRNNHVLIMLTFEAPLLIFDALQHLSNNNADKSLHFADVATLLTAPFKPPQASRCGLLDVSPERQYISHHPKTIVFVASIHYRLVAFFNVSYHVTGTWYCFSLTSCRIP